MASTMRIKVQPTGMKNQCAQGPDDRGDLSNYLRQFEFINGQEYIPLRATKKPYHRFRLDRFAAHLSLRGLPCIWEEEHRVSYYKPSLTYNLDQLLRIASKEATSSYIENVIPRSRQEVHGVKE